MSGKVFINYRRGEDSGFAGRLFDRLENAFSREQLFMDVDSIEPGLDFQSILEDQVASCDVLLALIGRGWLAATDEVGLQRLADPTDFVRVEIEAGLAQGKLVIPVLIGEANMPQWSDLPAEIRPLARRQAIRLTHERFGVDADRLIGVLGKALKEAEERRAEEDKKRAEEEARNRAEEDKKRPEEEARNRAEEDKKRPEEEEEEEEEEQLNVKAVGHSLVREMLYDAAEVCFSHEMVNRNSSSSKIGINRLHATDDRNFVRPRGRDALISISIGVYAVILIFGLLRLGHSPEAWQGWLNGLRSPLGLILQALVFIFSVIHTTTWFNAVPRALQIIRGGNTTAGKLIVGIQYAALSVISFLVLILAGAA